MGRGQGKTLSYSKSGKTFDGIKTLLIRSRSKISFLECVPDLTQEEVGEDGMAASDADFIVETLEAEGFTAIAFVHNCRSSGWPMDRFRLWVVVFDIPRNKMEPYIPVFHQVLNALQCEGRWHVKNFLIGQDTLERMTAPLLDGSDAANIKRPKKDMQRSGDCRPSGRRDHWKDVHCDAFSRLGLGWPVPACNSIQGFRRRESEVVYAADVLFPSDVCMLQDDLIFSFFDANHTFERTFNWPPPIKETEDEEEEKEDKPLRDKLKCPWKRHVPTLTGNSRIAVRCHNSEGRTVIRALHGLEAMALQGWDLPLWKKNPYQDKGINSSSLMDLAGNMWCAGSYLPIAIAAFGTVPWMTLKQADLLESASLALNPSSIALDSDDDAEASSDDGMFG